jgi:hypothetical protein
MHFPRGADLVRCIKCMNVTTRTYRLEHAPPILSSSSSSLSLATSSDTASVNDSISTATAVSGVAKFKRNLNPSGRDRGASTRLLPAVGSSNFQLQEACGMIDLSYYSGQSTTWSLQLSTPSSSLSSGPSSAFVMPSPSPAAPSSSSGGQSVSFPDVQPSLPSSDASFSLASSVHMDPYASSSAMSMPSETISSGNREAPREAEQALYVPLSELTRTVGGWR